MNIDNITSENMVLTNDGKAMQISIYEKEIKRLNNIINELEKSIIFKLTEFKRNKDYFIDEKDIEQLYEELNELKESGNNE